MNLFTLVNLSIEQRVKAMHDIEERIKEWHNNITSEDKKLEHDFRPLCQNVLKKFLDDRKISN